MCEHCRDAYTQAYVERLIGRKDKSHMDLICLVHDPDVIPIGILRDLVDPNDPLRRIKLTGYFDIPHFDGKTYHDVPRIKECGDSLCEDPEDPRAKLLVEREAEFFSVSRNQYGLNRGEAVSYGSLKLLLSRVNGDPDLSIDESDIVRLKLGNSMVRIVSKLKDLFSE